MEPLDRFVVGAYLAGLFALGLASARSAGRTGDAYALGDRRVAWWTLGLVDSASRSAHDVVWVAAIAAGGLLGLQARYWAAAVVALPLAIVWARYRRRLRLRSGPELFTARYGERARPLRAGFSVVVGLGFGTFALGALVRVAAEVTATLTGWSVAATVAAVVGGALAAALPGGLLGVARAGLLHAAASLAGRVVLAAVAVSAAGGLGALVPKALERRSATFLSPLPSADGSLGVSAPELLVLLLLAALATGRVSGLLVQRDLAASSDDDAGRARTLQAILALGIRVLPVLLIGLAAVSVVPDARGLETWGALVGEVARPGVRGWLVVGLLATFAAATGDALLAVAASLWNDIVRPHLAPDADDVTDVRVLRGGVLIGGLAVAGWAVSPVPGSALELPPEAFGLLAAATLPAAALRWLWWRFNLAGEAMAWLGAVPLVGAVWIAMDPASRPIAATAATLGLATLTTVTASLATRATPKGVLTEFFARVRPVGHWAPVAALQPRRFRRAAALHARTDLESIVAGVMVGLGATFGVAAVLDGSWSLLVTAGPVAGIAAVAHAALTRRRRWIDARTRPEDRPEGVPGAAEAPDATLPDASSSPGAWPRRPRVFASSFGRAATEAALYSPDWEPHPRTTSPIFVTVDDPRAVHRAGVRWSDPVDLVGVKLRFAAGHVARSARVGIRRPGAAGFEWTGPFTGGIPEILAPVHGPAVAVVVEQSPAGGSRENPGVLGIACLVPELARHPHLELLLEHPGGLHRPSLPLAIDEVPTTSIDLGGATALVLQALPARPVGAIGIEFARLGPAGSSGLVGAWLQSVRFIDLDGTPVAVRRHGIDGSTSGVVAGSTRVVLRLAGKTVARRVRIPLTDAPGGAAGLRVRRVSLDPRPVAYPTRVPMGPAGALPTRVRPALEIGVPGSDLRVRVGPDGTLLLPVPGRDERVTVVGASVDGVEFVARERARDLRTGILVDQAEVGGLRLLRSVIPAAGSPEGVELRLVIQNRGPTPRTAVLRVGRVLADGMCAAGPEEVAALPVHVAPGGVARESVWLPREPDAPLARGPRPGPDPEREMAALVAGALENTVSFRLPGEWDSLARKLLIAAVTRPPSPPGSADVSDARLAEGLAVWGARQTALETFQAAFGGARVATGAGAWTPLRLLRWAGLTPEHARRVAARKGASPRPVLGVDHDAALRSLWAGRRGAFLEALDHLEQHLDTEVMVHWEGGEQRWSPASELPRPTDEARPRHALGCHLALLRHAVLTELPREPRRGVRLRLFGGLPPELWGEPLRLLDFPSLAGPVSMSLDPLDDGRVKVKVSAPGADRVEVVPPIGDAVVLPGGDRTILLG